MNKEEKMESVVRLEEVIYATIHEQNDTNLFVFANYPQNATEGNAEITHTQFLCCP